MRGRPIAARMCQGADHKSVQAGRAYHSDLLNPFQIEMVAVSGSYMNFRDDLSDLSLSLILCRRPETRTTHSGSKLSKDDALRQILNSMELLSSFIVVRIVGDKQEMQGPFSVVFQASEDVIDSSVAGRDRFQIGVCGLEDGFLEMGWGQPIRPGGHRFRGDGFRRDLDPALMRDSRTLQSIKSKLIAFALLATLVPSVGLGLLSFWGYQAVLNDNVSHELHMLGRTRQRTQGMVPRTGRRAPYAFDRVHVERRIIGSTGAETGRDPGR